MRRGSREILELFVSGVTGMAFLAGLAPMVNLLIGPIGGIFFVAALIGGTLYLLLTLRSGNKISRGILELTLWGVVSFGSVYGTMWYFISYLPSSGKPIIEFKIPEFTPRPSSTPQATLTPSPPSTPKPTSTRQLIPTSRPTANLTAAATRRP